VIGAFQAYQAANGGQLPNNLDGIVNNSFGTITTDYDAPDAGSLQYDASTGDLVDDSVHLSNADVVVPSFLIDYFAGQNGNSGKVELFQVGGNTLAALSGAGLTHARFLADGAHDDDTSDNPTDIGTLAIDSTDTAASTVNFVFPTKAISDQDFPARAYDAPRPKSGANRSRGFSKELSNATVGFAADAATLLRWKPGSLGYNNTKVGGKPDQVLLAFGIGNKSSLVDGDRAILKEAPNYGAAKPSEYPRYFALISVGTEAEVAANEAGDIEFITIVDGRGEFLDEEIAEATGQYSN
jgi:hypothetical protein